MTEKACDISFMEKARSFSHDYLKCARYVSESAGPEYIFTKKLYSKLIATSQILEDFLDFHGAKNNKDWYYYRELSAAVRHLALAGYSENHISNRLIFYDLFDTDKFIEQGAETRRFITGAIRRLSPAILEEATRLSIPIPEEIFGPDDFPGIITGESLAFDIDDEDRDIQKKHIVKIASDFLGIVHTFEDFSFFEPMDIEKVLTVVPDKVNEVTVRGYEMVVHNLQSSFDTYVIHGGLRFGNRKLKRLRGHFSVVFHLLQTMGRLLHFYERHLHKSGFKNIYITVQNRLVEMVDPDLLLDRVVNYGLFFICRFLLSGRSLAKEILNENIERGSITVGIPVKRGFHARPSLLVAKIVQHYGGEVQLKVGEDTFDAASVLDLQWAGGKIQKEDIQRVSFEGDVRALKDIEILASVNYGEDTMGKGVPLPKELLYLR